LGNRKRSEQSPSRKVPEMELTGSAAESTAECEGTETDGDSETEIRRVRRKIRRMAEVWNSQYN
jgi:hypothetical protein